MIRFFWKYRYYNLFIIFLTFVLSVFYLKNLKVFFESERIIELSNVEKDIIDKSLDDKNLILVGLEFSDSLSYESLVLIKSQLKLLDQNKKIKFQKLYLFFSFCAIFSFLFWLSSEYENTQDLIFLFSSFIFYTIFISNVLKLSEKGLLEDFSKELYKNKTLMLLATLIAFSFFIGYF